MRKRINWNKVLSIVLALSLLAGMTPYVMGRTIAQQPTDGEALTAGGNVIPDVAFKKKLNDILSRLTHTERQDDEPVTAEDMAKIQLITINSDEAVSSIEGIQYAPDLIHLEIQKSNVAGLEQIKTLKNLEGLTIRDSTVNLSWFAELTKLETLDLGGCTGFRDLKDLGYKPALTRLDLYHTWQEGAVSLKSLDGLSPENFPELAHLNLEYCSTLRDISALSNKLPKLATLDMSALQFERNYTDFSPLKGYTTLKKLNLEKVQINDQNRESYKEMIRSLVNLEELHLSYCEISDQDVDMFAPLQKLKTLCLNLNNLTNTDFCSYLPRDIEVLSLHGNNIANMDNIGELTNLRILGMGGNRVNDFRFLKKLTKLTKESIRHAEGTERFPAFENYEVGNLYDPVVIVEGAALEIANPYVDINGSPISFANAMVPEGMSYTVRYDADTNKVIFENLTGGSVSAAVAYDVPLADGEVKHFVVRILSYVQMAEKYHVSYDWGTEFPWGQKLPEDNAEYNTEAEARAAKDQLFTDKTTVAGTRDGKKGIWHFSGWTAEVQGNDVRFVGSWTFVEDKYTVSYDWGTEFPEGQKLPEDNAVYNTEAEAQAAMDKQFTHETAVAGTRNGKKGIWHFSGWTAEVQGNEVRFAGSWTFVEDKYTVSYDWGTEFPEGQKLPEDNAVYNTEAEAQAAVDKQFTHETAVAGTCNGKEGTWRFSGWTAEVQGNEVRFAGSWTFVGDKYTVSYDWGTEFPEDQKLPEDNAVYNTEAEAQAAMDKQFTHETTVAGTCNGKEGTWRFSGWTANEADDNHVVTFTGIWEFTQEDTTPGGSPDTGDAIVWMCLLLITSAAALATTVYAGKKHS